jgi:hypothetical protein
VTDNVAQNGSIVPGPNDICWNDDSYGKTKVLGENPASVTLFHHETHIQYSGI